MTLYERLSKLLFDCIENNEYTDEPVAIMSAGGETVILNMNEYLDTIKSANKYGITMDLSVEEGLKELEHEYNIWKRIVPKPENIPFQM